MAKRYKVTAPNGGTMWVDETTYRIAQQEAKRIEAKKARDAKILREDPNRIVLNANNQPVRYADVVKRSQYNYVDPVKVVAVSEDRYGAPVTRLPPTPLTKPIPTPEPKPRASATGDLMKAVATIALPSPAREAVMAATAADKATAEDPGLPPWLPLAVGAAVLLLLGR